MLRAILLCMSTMMAAVPVDAPEQAQQKHEDRLRVTPYQAVRHFDDEPVAIVVEVTNGLREPLKLLNRSSRRVPRPSSR